VRGENIILLVIWMYFINYN